MISTRPSSFSLALVFLALALFCMLPLGRARAQSLTSGDLAGTVTDPTGAVIPGAKLVLINTQTGAARTTTTGVHGDYRFSLLPPGAYTVEATAAGFTPKKAAVTVNVGQVEAANLALQVGAATQTVTVTGEAAPVQINNANISTSFSAAQVALVPNGGGDLTAMVQTAPGAVMNTQGGYGNFETYGLPATSNLFTINGQPDNDPFLNLNNSGPTNLMLGSSGVEQVTVTNNGYSGQYGSFGGANVNYVTKSGTNQFHGTAVYNWNGRAMNANSFFNNANGAPRSFDNINNWTVGFGGPIVKDKTFFYVNSDGLYTVLPTSVQALIPSPAFESATLTNLAATGNSAQVPFYSSLFGLYNAAPGAGRAAALPLAAGETGSGCGTFTGLPAGTPCALAFQSNANNRTHEWDLAFRIDQHLDANDSMYFRYSLDRGVQATNTDPINSAFDIFSNQPEYQGQYNWTHSFSGGSVNQFNANANHYDAIFGTDAAARAAVFPYSLAFSGGNFSTLGGIDDLFPQGRNVTQYGLTDDYSTVHGIQTWKAGVQWTMNLINDYDLGILSTPLVVTNLANFFAGSASFAEQAFPNRLNQPVRMYRMGVYFEDDVAITPSLKTTWTLRLQHDSNPVCLHDCVSRLTTPFLDLAHDPSVPYSSIIDTGLRQAFPTHEGLLWEPRFGFAWTPFGGNETVLRGGFGLFNDTLPGQIMDDLAGNAPNLNTFAVPGAIAPGAGSAVAAAAADNADFLSAFASGGTVGSITATNPGFLPPSFFSTQEDVKPPTYYEWNLEIQRQLGRNSSVSANYVGNHGVHEPVVNSGLNAFYPGFVGLPATAPDPRFGTVSVLQNDGISNYNGLVLRVHHRMTNNLEFGVNYTWSHALDEISNGGFDPFNDSTNSSVLAPQDPYDLRANYGNADYDVRNYLSLNYVWQLPFAHLFGTGSASSFWKDWTLAGSLFTRSGLPLTVIDTNATATLAADNYGNDTAGSETLFANLVAADGQNGACTVNKQCLATSAFSPTTATPTGFGDQMRNQFRGPKFFDTDLSVTKNTPIPGWEQGQLGLSIQFFNLFNHPNFDEPVDDVANPQFGQVISTISVPTSLLGSFLGGDASPRLIELTAKLTF
ncbi:MAG: carboxypeptidase regulatory-like domain-containing protein [Terriglobales bacterium]